jgi:hypothetical protein
MADDPPMATRGPRGSRRPRIFIPAAAGLPDLDGAAVWILGALRSLLRRGRPALRDAWSWVACFDDLTERMVLIRDHAEPSANRCPLVPVRMPVEVDVRPKPGEVLPVEYEEHQLGAVDNRRLVGKVAKVLIDHIALHQQAALRFRSRAQREDSAEASKKADGYAMQVRERAQRALRGVDLEELGRAVEAEAREPISPAPSPRLDITYVGDKLAIVSEGSTTVHVKGPRQVRLFRIVVEATGRDVAWSDLVRADLAACGEELDRRWRGRKVRGRSRDEEDQGGEPDGEVVEPATPRHATSEKSLQRAGNRIRTALGKLRYHWHQNGHGARWDPEVT